MINKEAVYRELIVSSSVGVAPIKNLGPPNGVLITLEPQSIIKLWVSSDKFPMGGDLLTRPWKVQPDEAKHQIGASGEDSQSIRRTEAHDAFVLQGCSPDSLRKRVAPQAIEQGVV